MGVGLLTTEMCSASAFEPDDNLSASNPTHLAIVHPERFQIVGVGARNHLEIIYLLHSSQIAAHRGFPDSGEHSRRIQLSANIEMRQMSTEAAKCIIKRHKSLYHHSIFKALLL